MGKKCFFATAVTCMDGRIIDPVNNWIKKQFAVDYIDQVPEPGINALLEKQANPLIIEWILNKIQISINRHQSKTIVVVGHDDCAGNPAEKIIQIQQIQKSVDFLKKKYCSKNNGIVVMGLWSEPINNIWTVNSINI